MQGSSSCYSTKVSRTVCSKVFSTASSTTLHPISGRGALRSATPTSLLALTLLHSSSVQAHNTSQRCFSTAGGPVFSSTVLNRSRGFLHPSSALLQQHNNNNNNPNTGLDEVDASDFLETSDDLHGELSATLEAEQELGGGWGSGGGGAAGAGSGGTGAPLGPGDVGAGLSALKRVKLVKLERPPGRFDLLTNSLAYKWETTAKDARKVSGPLREWASELKYRTGVHMEIEPTNPSRLALKPEDGGYATADEVEVTVFLFGSERGIFNCAQLMESIVDQEPSYVRLAVFRRIPSSSSSVNSNSGGEQESGDAASSTCTTSSNPGDVEWLLLRRINRELRPPDIPPISLKLPGKYTLLYEQYKEAAIRSLWEETGITVAPSAVFPTARLSQNSPEYYWRVPVHYFIAEVPYDVEVKGPQTEQQMYMRDWEKTLLRQSPDPIDRAWAAMADPETGCAWMRQPLIDELQRELRGEDYMRIRYTPPPYSELGPVVGLTVDDE